MKYNERYVMDLNQFNEIDLLKIEVEIMKLEKEEMNKLFVIYSEAWSLLASFYRLMTEHKLSADLIMNQSDFRNKVRMCIENGLNNEKQ